MKNTIRKILLGDQDVREYVTVRVGENISESVFLNTKEFALDISDSHWLLSLDPMVLGVWVGDKNKIEGINTFQIIFKSSHSSVTEAVVDAVYFDSIPETNGTLYLLEVTRSRIFQRNWFIRTGLYKRYFSKRQPSNQKFKSLVAAFSYPRNVKLVSFKLDHYYNIFPMDLLGQVNSGSFYVFGLRHSNITLEKMIQSAKVVVAEISYEQKKLLYELGKHHGSDPPPVQELPFRVNLTSQFGFYIPEWVENYKEISITKKLNLGSHMLLWGEVLQSVNLSPGPEQLAHIHFLHYLQQLKNGTPYRLAE